MRLCRSAAVTSTLGLCLRTRQAAALSSRNVLSFSRPPRRPPSIPRPRLASSRFAMSNMADSNAEIQIEPTNNNDAPVRLIWHRRDLRLHDNALYANLADTDPSCSVISLFVLDPHDYIPRPSTAARSHWDAIRIGPHFARCLLEALEELRSNLRAIGGELVVRVGDPARVVPEMAESIGATEVCWNEIPGTDEAKLSQAVLEAITQNVKLEEVKVKTGCGYTLYHPDDLPNEAETWQRLAHPNQKKSKKKKNKKKQTNGNISTNSYELPEGYVMPQHELIDVSPQRLKGMCLVMGDYRRAVRSHAKVRPLIDAPTGLTLPPKIKDGTFDVGSIPTLEELYGPLQDVLDSENRYVHDNVETLSKKDGRNQRRKPILGLPNELVRSAITYAVSRQNDHISNENNPIYRGGESAALERLSYFLSSGRASCADRSKADVVTNDASSRFSMHLALGTLSPRTIYHAVSETNDTEGTQWLQSHLEMRDYFIYFAFRSEAGLFRLEGAVPSLSFQKGQHLVWKDPSDANNREVWTKWAQGQTGFPLVDAAMTELLQTGYCSNRVRQNAASFLVKDLQLDWRAGAELFQFLLDDFCVAANWGNWAYFSGVGSDPKQRHFRTISQALTYDPDGAYVRRWLEKLKSLDEKGQKEGFFMPWKYLGDDWPELLVDEKMQLTWHDLERLENTGQLIPPGDDVHVEKKT